MAKSELSHSFVLSILDYNKDTGVFVWRERTPEMFKDGKGRYTKEHNCKVWNSKYEGKVAGHAQKCDKGRRQIRINDVLYSANVIAWFYVHAEWPDFAVDHKDQNPSNDKFINLRLSTNGQNAANKTKNKNNTAGYKGVCYCKARKKYVAGIGWQGKRINLGRFNTAEEAHAAYCKAARELFGEFACFD